mmetsp:Transcript_93755/g.262269  ORF Transcript_93755/g.262269 Transcript_93755/m.262269 type:complete len:263 (-) Transcript_93755:25-813(-)
MVESSLTMLRSKAFSPFTSRKVKYTCPSQISQHSSAKASESLRHCSRVVSRSAALPPNALWHWQTARRTSSRWPSTRRLTCRFVCMVSASSICRSGASNTDRKSTAAESGATAASMQDAAASAMETLEESTRKASQSMSAVGARGCNNGNGRVEAPPAQPRQAPEAVATTAPPPQSEASRSARPCNWIAASATELLPGPTPSAPSVTEPSERPTSLASGLFEASCFGLLGQPKRPAGVFKAGALRLGAFNRCIESKLRAADL